MMKLLEGKCAVVTGSTRGIGLAIAIELARSGARVVLNHRGRGGAAGPEAEAAVRQLRELAGWEPRLVEADVTQEKEVSALAYAAVRALGRLDIWVNNVGLHLVTPAFELNAEEWERLFRINLTSAFIGCRQAAMLMKDSGGGSIISIASKMGLVGRAENSCYCAAKAGIKMMSECLAAEWAPLGIRVNVVAPGVTRTEPTYRIIRGHPEVEASLCYRTPMGRLAEPEEIGRAVVFLASELSSYVTGATLACDGGWVAGSDFAGIPIEKLEDWRREFPRLG
jgi:NAD(P)-dependent dehydrogenase (short-subunit alcohol dehydrogenase family)